MNQIRMKSTTSQHTVDDAYKCDICKDTGWVFGENGYKRCSCFKREKNNRLWQKYGVNPQEIKKLSEYEPVDDIEKFAVYRATKYIKDFEKTKSLRENGFGLFGQPGSGKTHIINAIGAALLNQGIEVIYMPYVEVMRELKANANDDEYYIKLSQRYQRASVLIIDDLFKDKFKNCKLIDKATITETDMKHLYPIINYRYQNCLPTLFSTEATPTLLTFLDEALAGRILESCGNNITIFQGTKYNYRMKKFAKKEE